MVRERNIDRRSFLKAAGGAVAAATTTSAAGCLESLGGGGDTLSYARGNDSGSLDPQATSSGEDAKVINQMYDQVIHFKPGETSLEAGLAEEFELDGDTVTLKLREDATFHNGDDVTAADFKATYRRFLDENYEHFIGAENTSYYGSYLLGSVENVETNGDYEIELQLAKPYAPMLRNLAVFAFAIIPESAITGDRDLAKDPVGSGPFEFDEWNESDGLIRLSANDDYWGKSPEVGEVVFRAIGENSSRAQTLDTGDVDIIDGLGSQAAQQVRDSDNAELVEEAGINIGYMAMNMERVEAFRDKRVRQAINYAIDTQSIVEDIFSGLAVQASQPVPESMMGYNSDLDPYPHDPEKAQSLLEEAGHADLSFELATFQNPRTYNPSPVDAAQNVKSDLADIGVEVSIKQDEFNAFLEYTDSGKHDACFLGWMTDNADPDNFYYALLHPGSEPEDGQDWVSFDDENFNTFNVAAWANRDYTQLVEEAQSTLDEGERRQQYEEASKIAHEEAPWVFIDHAKELRGVHNRVDGFVLAPISGPFLNRVSLSE